MSPMTEEQELITIFTSPVLSSEVGDVQFVTEQDHAEVVVKSGDGSDVYSAHLYPDSNGICTVWQLGDIITQWMIDHDVSFGQFTVIDTVRNMSMTYYILLSSRVSNDMVGGYEAIASRPLLSCRLGLIPPDGMMRLHFIPAQSQDMKVSALVFGKLYDGSSSQAAVTLNPDLKDNKICCLTVRADVIMDDINDDLDDDDEFKEITAITLRHNSSGMYASVIVSSDQDLIGFNFLNCWGLVETIYLHAEIIPDLKLDVELAVIGHRTVQYDIERSQSFKVEASNITGYSWPAVSQFITSPYVTEVNSGRRIFLSEINQEPPRTHDSLGSLKFSYSYEDDRILI